MSNLEVTFACCGDVQDLDLQSEIVYVFPTPSSCREILAFLCGVTLQDVERWKHADNTLTAKVQTHGSAALQHVESVMTCLPEDVPQSAPEACESLKQIQFPCVHRGMLGCIMACVFHGQSCDVKKAGGRLTTKVLFFCFSKFVNFGVSRSIFFFIRACRRLAESSPDDVGGRSLLCWSSSGGCCHVAYTRARNASR